MKKLLYTIQKEWLLLIRDKAGLLVLFVMPVALVFVITLLQDAPIRNFQRAQIPIIFVDNDRDKLGRAIENGLIEVDYFELHKSFHDQILTPQKAKQAVAEGKFKVGIIVPQGATAQMEQNAVALYKTKISISSTQTEQLTSEKDVNVIIYFDPTIQKLFKTAVLSSLASSLEKIKSEVLLRTFSKEILNEVSSLTGGMVPLSTDAIQLSEKDTEIIKIQEEFAANREQVAMPNSVQHNVPAWSMFAIFFIALPLAGNIIKERDSGSLKRLLSMPISYSHILMGKIIVHIFVSIIQFILLMILGMVILPLLGTPVLNLGNTPLGLVILVLSSACAATGYGILIGTIATTQEQASTFSAVSIIIAAALGGVMIPVYLMPHLMQQISIISPLAWGLNAFLDIFVRGALFMDILPNVMALLLFSAVSLFIAVFMFKLKAQKI